MKGVIYARYSSDNQREKSIEGQLRECKAFAEKNDIQIVENYIDRGFSVRTEHRPDFQRMIKDICLMLCLYGSLTVLLAIAMTLLIINPFSKETALRSFLQLKSFHKALKAFSFIPRMTFSESLAE